MKFSDGLQKAISYGYIFLIALGMLKQSIFYYPFKINILKYSSLSDILMAPFVDLFSHPLVLIISVVLIVVIYLLFHYGLGKNHDKPLVRKLFAVKGEMPEGEAFTTFLTNHFLRYMAYLLFCFFIGLGVGTAKNIKERLANNTLNYKTQLVFDGGEAKQVYMVGSNSGYHFYINKGEGQVSISPLGAVKTITRTAK